MGNDMGGIKRTKEESIKPKKEFFRDILSIKVLNYNNKNGMKNKAEKT
jgi:hypothetical protein